MLDNPLGRGLQSLFVKAVAAAFSTPILNTMLLSEMAPVQQFFKLPASQRDCLARIASFLDPQTDLSKAHDDLFSMLKSDVLFLNIAAAHLMPVHAYTRFATVEPFLRSLFDELDAKGRLWMLLSFSVLLPDTPQEWIGLLEDFTRRMVEEHPESFNNTQSGILQQLDIAMLPLGLAYAKRGPSMPYFETLIKDSLERNDMKAASRYLAGLGSVGFYYPEAMFNTLHNTITDFTKAEIQAAILQPLATVRTLHFDDVDIFLNQVGADNSLRRRISAAAGVESVRRYIYWLGLYNNVVHEVIFYPRMRKQLSMWALNSLAIAQNPRDFIVGFTNAATNMFRDAGYKLVGWTLP